MVAAIWCNCRWIDIESEMYELVDAVTRWAVQGVLPCNRQPPRITIPISFLSATTTNPAQFCRVKQ